MTKLSASLTLRQVETTECGTYTCKLSNSVSQISVDFLLTVKGKVLGLTCLFIYYFLLPVKGTAQQ